MLLRLAREDALDVLVCAFSWPGCLLVAVACCGCTSAATLAGFGKGSLWADGLAGQYILACPPSWRREADGTCMHAEFHGCGIAVHARTHARTLGGPVDG